MLPAVYLDRDPVKKDEGGQANDQIQGPEGGRAAPGRSLQGRRWHLVVVLIDWEGEERCQRLEDAHRQEVQPGEGRDLRVPL